MGTPPLPSFGGTVFLPQNAHVAVLDTRGQIITVNDAWLQFGRDNGLDAAYRFIGASYPDVCERAIGAQRGFEGAREALDGIKDVLAMHRKRFSLIYPCHAPAKERWFLMYARPIAAVAQGAVVSHIDVTSLRAAGLLPDETGHAPPDSRETSAKLAQLLFRDG